MPRFHAISRRLDDPAIKSIATSGYGWGGGLGGLASLPNAGRYDLWREHGNLERNAVISRASAWIANHVGLGRLVCGNVDAAGKYKETSGQPMVESLARPNPWESWEETLGSTVTDLCFGNAYWLIQDPEGLAEQEVWWLPACLVWPEPEPDERIAAREGPVRQYWYTYLAGRSRAYPPGRIIHFRNRRLDPNRRWMGRNDVADQIGSTAAIDLLIRFTVAALRNGHAGKILTPKQGGLEILQGSPAEDEVNRVARQIEGGLSGENVGRITKTSLPMDLIDAGLGPEAMALDRIGDVPIALALGAMGLNMMALDLPGSHAVSTFANRAEAKRAAVEEAVISREDLIAGKLTSAYLPLFPTPKATVVWWDRRNVEILREDANARAQRTTLLADIASVNERREMVDLPPVKGGEKTPVEQAQEDARQARQAGDGRGLQQEPDDRQLPDGPPSRNGVARGTKSLPFGRWVAVDDPAGNRHALKIGGGRVLDCNPLDSGLKALAIAPGDRLADVVEEVLPDELFDLGFDTETGAFKSIDLDALKARAKAAAKPRAKRTSAGSTATTTTTKEPTKKKPKPKGTATRRKAGVACTPTGSGRGNPCHAESTGHFAREGGAGGAGGGPATAVSGTGTKPRSKAKAATAVKPAKLPPRSRRTNGRGTKAQRKKLADQIRTAKAQAKDNPAVRDALRSHVRELRAARNTTARARWQVKPKDLVAAPAKPRGAAKPKTTPKPNATTPKPKAAAKPKAEPKTKPRAAPKTKTEPKQTASSKPGPGGHDLRKRVESQGTDARPLQASIDHIRANRSGEAVPVQHHGMSTPESMRSVEFEGIRYHFPANEALDFNHSGARTLSTLLGEKPLPRSLTRHTTDVYLTTQANAQDPQTAALRGLTTFRSAATGSDGKIVVYRGEPATSFVLTHEMGHNLAQGRYGSTTPRVRSDFGEAQRTRSREDAPTEYGQNNNAEDFAESVRLYATEPETLRKVAPKRYAVLDRMIKDESYAG